MSSNEEYEDDLEHEDEDLNIVITDFAAIQPYQYEPIRRGEDDDDDDYVRKDTENAVLQRSTQAASEWCKCGHCMAMTNNNECRCCLEISKIVKKCDEAPNPLECITVHPGFRAVTLDPWNLQAVYAGYHQQYGKMAEPTLHEKYRYTAYRHFVRWCWGYVGKSVRVHLPSCVLNAIRAEFPSDNYRGFQLPSLEYA